MEIREALEIVCSLADENKLAVCEHFALNNTALVREAMRQRDALELVHVFIRDLVFDVHGRVVSLEE